MNRAESNEEIVSMLEMIFLEEMTPESFCKRMKELMPNGYSHEAITEKMSDFYESKQGHPLPQGPFPI